MTFTHSFNAAVAFVGLAYISQSKSVLNKANVQGTRIESLSPSSIETMIEKVCSKCGCASNDQPVAIPSVSSDRSAIPSTWVDKIDQSTVNALISQCGLGERCRYADNQKICERDALVMMVM